MRSEGRRVSKGTVVHSHTLAHTPSTLTAHALACLREAGQGRGVLCKAVTAKDAAPRDQLAFAQLTACGFVLVVGARFVLTAAGKAAAAELGPVKVVIATGVHVPRKRRGKAA